MGLEINRFEVGEGTNRVSFYGNDDKVYSYNLAEEEIPIDILRSMGLDQLAHLSQADLRFSYGDLSNITDAQHYVYEKEETDKEYYRELYMNEFGWDLKREPTDKYIIN